MNSLSKSRLLGVVPNPAKEEEEARRNRSQKYI